MRSIIDYNNLNISFVMTNETNYANIIGTGQYMLKDECRDLCIYQRFDYELAGIYFIIFSALIFIIRYAMICYFLKFPERMKGYHEWIITYMDISSFGLIAAFLIWALYKWKINPPMP